ncbi:MAG: hypothetical protein IT355_05655 [Gemmatimonadaceae bacterium]|nr:hypothetical protein [Gemmatimonadaceae bacterium]
MSQSVRAWLLLGVTLCLGIALGLLGGGALQERRLARVNDLRRPGGFIEHARSVIRPTSDSQWTAIRPHIEETARRNADMRRAHDSAMRVALDTLRARLAPMLDAAQRERFARFVPGPRGGPFARPGGRGPRRAPQDDAPPPPDGPPLPR